tara:strand:+ start:2246 stop:2596 length:351 start_codon:yes stop_codon:yes gene_type:complete
VSSAKSVKAKGRRLQNLVRDLLRSVFSFLHEDDIKSQTMGMCGEDIILTPKARKYIPYSFECKNVEKLNVWNAIDQCKENCGDRIPVVVMKKNRRNPYAILPLKDFMSLIEVEDEG